MKAVQTAHPSGVDFLIHSRIVNFLLQLSRTVTAQNHRVIHFLYLERSPQGFWPFHARILVRNRARVQIYDSENKNRKSKRVTDESERTLFVRFGYVPL